MIVVSDRDSILPLYMGNLLILFIAGEFMKATLLRVLARLVGTTHIAYPRLHDLAIFACRQQLIALRRTTVIEATLVAGRIRLGSGHGSWRLRTDAGSWLHVSCGIQIYSSNGPQRGAQDAFLNVWHHGREPVESNVLRTLDAQFYDIRFLANKMPQ